MDLDFFFNPFSHSLHFYWHISPLTFKGSTLKGCYFRKICSFFYYNYTIYKMVTRRVCYALHFWILVSEVGKWHSPPAPANFLLRKKKKKQIRDFSRGAGLQLWNLEENPIVFHCLACSKYILSSVTHYFYFIEHSIILSSVYCVPCTIQRAWDAVVNNMPTFLLYIPVRRDTNIQFSKIYSGLMGIGGLEKNSAGNGGNWAC